MIRFIIKRSVYDSYSLSHNVTHETFDAECPELESALCRGGYGPTGHDTSTLVGVEVLPSGGAVGDAFQPTPAIADEPRPCGASGSGDAKEIA